MKARLILIPTLLLHCSIFAGNDPSRKNDSPASYKIITKTRLVHLIDSVFDLKRPKTSDIELLNYYSSILKNSNSDTVRISDFSLKDLSFYSQKDEQLLFPPAKTNEMPSSLDLIAENSFLGYYSNPINGVVTSNYGLRDGKLHKGIDIDLNRGDKVKAAFSGKVRFAKKQGGYGNVVILMHLNGLETVYAHLSRIKVKEGDIVHSGQTIGLGGNTGHSRGTHLHFEVRYKGHALNPGSIISFTEQKLYYHTLTIKNSRYGLCAFPSNSHLHKVNKGESWRGIAYKYGLSLKELMALNGTGRRYYLKVGQQLRVN
jgi:murein DD-endopeptidase MepM/ murein hydrolase activator NlpD